MKTMNRVITIFMGVFIGGIALLSLNKEGLSFVSLLLLIAAGVLIYGAIRGSFWIRPW